jgi:hypothetical protein
MRSLAIVVVLVLAFIVTACAGPPKPGFYYAKPGLAESAYEEDVKLCRERGRQAMRDYGKQQQVVAGAAPVNYHDPKYGAAPGIAANATNSMISGFERGRAKARASAEAHKACMVEKGYGAVQLTQAEGEAFASLSSDEQKKQFTRWATGQERTTNSQ